jgi:cytochrome bd-type quinol oxidase subunit 1
MDMTLGHDFGTLGVVLVAFVILFAALLMPLGIYFAMKKAAKQAEEQDRAHARQMQQQPH